MFNTLMLRSTAFAVQIVGNLLQVGPAPPGTPLPVTFALVETLAIETNGFSVSGFQAIPVNTAVPTITGIAQVGQTLTISNDTWTNSPVSYACQWYGNGVSIPGATSSTYLIPQANLGEIISVSVTASNEGGSAKATSAVTAPVTETAAQVDATLHWDPHAYTTDAATIVTIEDGMLLNSILDSAPGTFPIPPNSQPADNSPLGKFNSVLIVFNNYKHFFIDSPGKSIVVGNYMNSGKIEEGNTNFAKIKSKVAASGNPTLQQGLSVIIANWPVPKYWDVNSTNVLAVKLGLRGYPANPFPDNDNYNPPSNPKHYDSNW